MSYNQFCTNQIKTVENSTGYDCAAHLAEARCFSCAYAPSDIKHDGRFYISLHGRTYTECKDFKLLPELESKLESSQDKLKDLERLLE